jgi:hypothetical protein
MSPAPARLNTGNLFFGVLGGLAAALICAALWALITDASRFQIGFMAIGVGFAVAYAVRLLGKGNDQRFGIAVAILSLFGCLLGNYLAACITVAVHQHVSLVIVFFGLLPHMADIFRDNFQVMDLVFYFIGVSCGYRYAMAPLNLPQPAQ